MKKSYNFREAHCLSRLFRTYSFVKFLIPFIIFLNVSLVFGQGNKEDNGRIFTWDNTSFLDNIAKAPLERTPNAEARSVELTLPMLDGTTQKFKFLESPVLESGLVSNWIPIKTYQGHSDDLKTIVRLSVSKEFGVTVFLNTSGGMIAIQPLDVLAKRYKIARVTNEEGFECFTKEAEDVKEMAVLAACGSHAGTRRDYRMAIAATGEYTTFRGGAATAQSDITNLVNYMNALYEVEMALHFNLVSGNNSIIYTDGATDPFTPSAGSSSAAASQAGFNTSAFTGVMPASNYDIGHTLHYRNSGSGWDGQAGPGPCSASNNKAAGWSQINLGATFDLSRFGGIVGHEVAHQLGANHPFFSTSGSCNGNRNTATAYEPGGASTYMSYNGSCAPDNIGSGSRDLYFHTVNLNEMSTYLTGTGNSCAVSTPTSNTAPSVNGNPNGLTFNIPTRTPFELTGTATDAEGNTLTYTWEEFDTDMTSGGASPNAAATTANQPLFRSFPPTSSPTRIVPQLSDILANSQTQGEILPQVARTMKFRLTTRDRYTAGGVVLGGWACDEITLNVVDVGASGFAVSSQNTATTWAANGTNTATIMWDVAGTTAAPISCANVKILFSTDNGATFPYTLAASVPNNGSANVVIPSYPTFTGRVKVVCASGNIFFDINNAPITISSSCTAEAATIAPTTAVNTQAGGAALNLNLTPQYGTSISPFAGSITASSATANLSYSSTWNSGACSGPSNANKYESVAFQVNNSGTYNFSLTSGGNLVMNLYQTSYNAASVCTNWLASSTTQASSGGSLSIGTTLSYSLTPGTNYVLVVSSFSNAQPASLPAAFSVAISGAGSALNGVPNPGASFNYAYVVVNTATNNITAIQTTSDLTSAGTFPVGSYKVHGLSYISTTTLASLQATYGGAAFTALQNALAGLTFCGDLSTNSVMVTVVPACVLPTINAPTVTQPTCVLATGTIVVNATGSGTLEYSIDNGSNWTTFNTFANLVAGNYNIRVRLQSDPSCVATYASNPVAVNPQPAIPTAPVVGAITNATCAVATGSVAFSGLPAAWTLTRSPGAVATNGTGATTTVSGIPVGSYTYIVTNTASGCVSPASTSIGIAPYPTSLSSLTVAPSAAVSAAAGAAALNLGLSPQYGTNISPFAGSITTSSTTSNLSFSSAGACSGPSNANRYESTTFQVNNSGTYSFSNTSAGGLIMNLYQTTYDAASVCTNWLASSGTRPGSSGSITLGSTLSYSLTPGTNYVLVVSSFSNSQPATLPAAFSVAISGAGSAVNGIPNPGASFSFAYVVVNTVSNTVAAIQATSDLTALGGGTYSVYGLSYQTPTTLANLQTYVSGTFAAFQTALSAFTFCGNLSSNNVSVTITSTSTCPTLTTAPANVTIVNSTCASACTVSGGSITAPTGTPCPAGATIQYSVGSGAFSSTLPTYTSSIQSIRTRCSCNAEPTTTVSPISAAVETAPGTCTTPNVLTVGAITQPNCTVPTGSVVLSGLPSGSWTINPGGVTGSGTMTTLASLSANTYNFTVTNSSGCTSPATPATVVTINNPPAVPTIASAVATIANCNGGNGAIEVTVSGGTSPFRFSRDNGLSYSTATTSPFTFTLPAATYQIKVKDATDCVSAATSVTVVQPAVVSVTLVRKVNIKCKSELTGEIEVSADGGRIPSDYHRLSLNGGFPLPAFEKIFTGLSAGTYNITATDDFGCTGALTVNLTEPSAPLSIGTVSTTPVTCTAGGSVTITGTSGGTAASTYTFALSPTLTNTTGMFTGLSATTYTLTVTDDNGCSKTQAVVVGSSSAPSITVSAQTNLLCNGATTGAFTFSVAGGMTPYTIVVKNPANATITGTGSNPYTYSSLAAGAYTISVTDNANCTATQTVTLTQPSTPLSMARVVTNVDCNGAANGTIQVTASGGTAPYQFSKDGGGTYTSGVTPNPYTFTSLGGGSFPIQIKDVNNCSIASVTEMVVDPVVLAFTTSKTNEICGQANGTATISATGGTGTKTITCSNCPSVGVAGVFSSLTANTYNFTVTDSKNCTKMTSVVVSNDVSGVPSAPTVGTITQPTCVVLTGSVVLNGLPASGTWTLTRSPDNVTTTGTGTSTTLGSLPVGTYTYTVKNALGCTSVASAPVAITAPSTLTIANTPTNVTCNGGNGQIVVTVTGGTNPYRFSSDNGVTYSTATTSPFTFTLPAATYQIKVKDANDCVSSTISEAITQPSALTVGTVSTTAATCLTNGTVTVTGTSGGTAPVNYTFKLSPSLMSTTGSFPSVAAGTYTLTVTDDNSCSATRSVTVSNSAAPTITVSSKTDILCNAGTTGAFTFSVSGGTSPYIVVVKDPLNTTITGTGTNPYTYSSLAAGTYNISVTDNAACTQTQAVVLTQPSAPLSIGTVSTTAATCTAGGTVTVTGTSGGTVASVYTFKLSPTLTNTTGSFTGVTAATYTLTVTDDNGCSKTQSVMVGSSSAPSITVSAQTNLLCNGATTGAFTFSVAGGITPYTIVVKNPSNATITGTGGNPYIYSSLAAGAYTISVTDNANCTATQTVTLTQPSIPLSMARVVTNVDCNGAANGTIQVTASGGTAPYQFSKDGGGTYTSGVTPNPYTFTSLGGGTFPIQVKDANNCTTPSVTETVVDPAVLAFMTSKTDEICGQANGTATVSATGGTGTKTITCSNCPSVAVAGVFSGLAANTYNFTVTDSKNCTKMTSVVITNDVSGVPLAPVIGTITQPTCAVQTGSIALSGLPASGTWTLTRNPGAVTSTGTGTMTTVAALTANTTYTFSVKSALGCASVTSGNAIVNAALVVPPVAPITGTLAVTTCAGATTTLASATADGLWSSGSTSVATIAPLTGVVMGISPGTSLISYTVDNGSCTKTVTATVTVSACCPIFSAPAPAVIVVNNTCESFCGGGSMGTISAPITACPAGSTLQYSLDNFATAPLSAPPAYTGTPRTISTRCRCDATPSIVSAVTSVTTTPQYCPPVLWISGGYATISTCEGSTVRLTGSTVGGTWGTTNPLIATVSADGVVKGIKDGSVGITYAITRGICTYTVNTPITVVNCPCPVLTLAAPAAVIVNSSCGVGCVPVAGSISAPRVPCPSGSILEYSTDSFRTNFSRIPPIYGSTVMSISTRCVCESTRDTVSPITTVRTAPVACLPTCIPTLAVAGGLKRETGDAVSATVGLFTNGLSQGTFNGSTYNWTNLASGQSFSIRPSRNDNPLMGVTTLDMSLISRHILEFDKLNSPYKIIAADVNRDGEVDASDMLLIRRLVLRIINEFPSNTAWRFVEKKYVFRDPTDPLAEDFPEIINLANLQTNVSNADFVAVKVGDVNYSATIVNGNPTNTSAELRGGKQVTLELTDQQLEKGTTYRIPLRVSSQARLTGLQFGLNWDRNKVENLRIEAGSLPNFNEGNTAVFGKEGIVTSAWAAADGVSVAEPTTVFYLVVQPKFNTRLTEIFSKNDVYTEGVAYDAVGTGSAVNLRFSPATKSDFQLMPNHPNPFTNQTVIPFLLPQDGQVKLTIYDLTGKLIFTKKETFAKGYNELLFKSEIDIPEGLYMYRLQTDTQMAERKMMIRR